MKYFFSIIFCLFLYSSQAQTDPQQMPDLDNIDLNIDFDQVFGLLDSLPMEFGEFGKLNELFSEQFGDLTQDKELLNNLLQQGLKTFEQMDMTEIQGLMDNFMKDFEGLDLEENFDIEEIEKLVDDHVKRKKI